MKKNYLKKGGVIEALVFFIISIMGIVFSIFSHNALNTKWELSPYLFPLFISIILFILSISLFVSEFKKESKNSSEKSDWKKIIIFVLLSIAYYFLVNILGFIITTLLFVASLFVLLGESRWWFILILSVSSTMIIWLLFGLFLHVMLPHGSLLYMLGI